MNSKNMLWKDKKKKEMRDNDFFIVYFYCFSPQLGQNLLPAGTSDPHLEHFIPAETVSMAVPQFGQNLAFRGTCIPQFEH